MDQFEGRVAVVTGAASGIGLALSRRAADEGMSVVLCDIEPGPLEAAAASLRETGAEAVAEQLDVSDEAAVDALAAGVFERFGAVHLLCNNAGVYDRHRPAWEHSTDDWRWVLGVNLWGVIHGIRSFVPRMLAGGEEGHIVNTASMAGLVTGGMGTAVYDASKHAVVSLSESLYRDLVVRTPKVGASVLCPGAVMTNIFEAERNRPAHLAAPDGELPPSSIIGQAPGGPFEPRDMADQVFAAVREQRFYVLAAQPSMLEWTKVGHDRMWAGKNPAVPHRLIAARDAGEGPA